MHKRSSSEGLRTILFSNTKLNHLSFPQESQRVALPNTINLNSQSFLDLQNMNIDNYYLNLKKACEEKAARKEDSMRKKSQNRTESSNEFPTLLPRLSSPKPTNPPKLQPVAQPIKCSKGFSVKANYLDLYITPNPNIKALMRRQFYKENKSTTERSSQTSRDSPIKSLIKEIKRSKGRSLSERVHSDAYSHLHESGRRATDRSDSMSRISRLGALFGVNESTRALPMMRSTYRQPSLKENMTFTQLKIQLVNIRSRANADEMLKNYVPVLKH